MKYNMNSRNLVFNEPETSQKLNIQTPILQNKIDPLVTFPILLKGIPYQYAGKSLEGFDC